MKKLLTYLLSAMMIFAVGCSEEFDDTAIWEKLNSLESRVAALEQLCKQMNTNITSLQSIVEALQNKDYVTSVAPITEDGKTIGYTITFSKSGAVTIYHGKDGKDGQNGANGKDGYTPTIGVAKASDGKYYWTLDGNWLTDNYGNKIKAEGRDGKDGADGKDGENGKDGADGKDGENGKDGADGITPKLKIENDYWYISYDDGKTWTELGKATGEDGDSMFQDVTYDDNYVYITLIDGTRVVIPCREVPAANEIWYTSSDGKIVTPYRWNIYDTKANIVSNVYKDGKGVITFDNNISRMSVQAFSGCSSLTSIIIPDGVTQIQYGTFDGCSSLTSINIPNGVTLIGERAFLGCLSLTSIIIPDSVTEIRYGAFNGCSHLTSINIPDGVTQIENGTFDGCSSLTSINIPNGVTLIGERAFSGCSRLTSINIPDGVTQIENGTFDGCSSLTSINIPNGVTLIGERAFSGCSSLTSITIPDGVTQIGNSAFSGCSILTSITIPDGVTQIGNSAFSGCSRLTSINIPDGVTQIGNSAFSGCSSLTSITIPDGVTQIGERAFWACSSLTSITFPKIVQEIGRDAFHSVTVVYCMSTQPPYLGWPNYFTFGTEVIYVPTNSVDAYKAADGWSDYADIIVGYDF